MKLCSQVMKELSRQLDKKQIVTELLLKKQKEHFVYDWHFHKMCQFGGSSK